MPTATTGPRRVIVLSDLHLGGEPPQMMSRPERLARFVESLPGVLLPDEALEVVVAGDSIDFLAVPPCESWTADPRRAVEKLDRVVSRQPTAAVFAALGRLLAAGHRLTVLIGNHDLELALPRVQAALLTALEATPHQVHFVDDGRAYRIGRLLIEHGNRYDGANENDWTNLRIVASAQSRGEDPPVELRVSAGSQLVEKVVAPLRPRYPFIDLLQPQGELVVLLLAAFEPGLILDLPNLARVLHADRLEARNRRGLQPGRTHAVAARAAAAPGDDELRRAFGDAYDTLRRPGEEVGFKDVLLAAWRGRKDGLAALLDRGEEIPQERLEQIRVAMRKLLLGDASDRLDGDTGPCGAAAERLIADTAGEIETVVMGHTHLPRHIGPPRRASYINSGAWIDVVRVPEAALEAGRDADLADFLRQLCRGDGRTSPATFADVRVEADGEVSMARLARAPEP